MLQYKAMVRRKQNEPKFKKLYGHEVAFPLGSLEKKVWGATNII